MEILIQKESDLDMSWFPGCQYDPYNKAYQIGPVGKIGPGSIFNNNDLTITTIPNCLVYKISLRNNDVDLYNQIKELLESFKTDNIDIKIPSPIYKNEKISTKPEYINNIIKIMEKNNMIEGQYNNLLNQLENLGCDISEISDPTYEQIPDEYFNWNEYYDYRVTFDVCCHSETLFYKFLLKNLLL